MKASSNNSNDPKDANDSNDQNIPREDINLADKLEELKESNNVFLNDLVLDDDSCNQISNFVKFNDIMVTLEGTDGYITSKGLAKLSEAISRSKTLRKVCFARNQISETDDSFFSTFCNGLSINLSIIELDLSQNMIGKKCCVHLSSVIRTNYILESINLSKNSIEDEGCIILLNALSLNSTIKNLELEGNSINNDVLQKINSILIQNRNKTRRDRTLFPASFENYPKFQIPRAGFLPNHPPFETLPRAPPINIVRSPAPIAPMIVPDVDNLRNLEIVSKYDKLLIDHQVLQEEATTYRQSFEKERMNFDLLKEDFARAIEEEKKIRFIKEEELNKLTIVMESNEMKLNKIIEEQKINFEKSLTRLENDLSQKNQENLSLKETNSKLEKIIDELQIKNDNLRKDHILRSEEFQQKLTNVNKEYQNSREELVKLLEIGKEQIAKDEIDQNRLRSFSEEKERQYNFLLQEFESKMMIERKNLNELMLENKELIDKLHETDIIINDCKKELFNKDQDLINLGKRYENDVANLKENLMKIDFSSNQKLSDQQLKINHLEDLLGKQKIENNDEKLKLLEDERAKLIKAEDLFNRKFNDMVMKSQDLEKIKFHLEGENAKLNSLLNDQRLKLENDMHVLNMTMNEQFRNDKSLIVQQWELKCNKLSQNREEILRRNNELLNEIENIKIKLSNNSALIVENNALKEDNITLSQTWEECKIEINRLNKELEEKSEELKKLKINLNTLSVENQKMGNDLTLASHTLNDYEQLQGTFNDLEFKYQEVKNKASFFENEFTKVKAYTETLLEQIANMKLQLDSQLIHHPHQINFIPPPHYHDPPHLIPPPPKNFVPPQNFSSPPDPLMEEGRLEYAVRPVTKYVKKTVVIPKAGNPNYQNHGFKPVPI